MQKEQYQNYYKNHGGYGNSEKINKNILENRIQTLKINLHNIFKHLNKNIRILEIGCGQGHFAEFIHREGFINYIGYDFDTKVIESNKKIFPKYHFSDGSVLKFFNENLNTFDIIFMSHVYEHMDIDEGVDMAKHIYLSLKTNGMWINIMPNAGAIFSATFTRYTDITHKTLYTSGSYNQILGKVGFKKEYIEHKNTIFRYFIFEYWQRIFRFIVFLLYRSLGYSIDSITTYEIISIIKKK